MSVSKPAQTGYHCLPRALHLRVQMDVALPCLYGTPSHSLRSPAEAGGCPYLPVRVGGWVSPPRQKGRRNTPLLGRAGRRRYQSWPQEAEGSALRHSSVFPGNRLETSYGLVLLYVLWVLGPARPGEGNSLHALQPGSFLKSGLGVLSIRRA